jgi:hypothetical protein
MKSKPSQTIRLKFMLWNNYKKENLIEKLTEFHTYKLKEERNYKVVLKLCTAPSALKKSKQKLGMSGILNNAELSYPK